MPQIALFCICCVQAFFRVPTTIFWHDIARSMVRGTTRHESISGLSRSLEHVSADSSSFSIFPWIYGHDSDEGAQAQYDICCDMPPLQHDFCTVSQTRQTTRNTLPLGKFCEIYTVHFRRAEQRRTMDELSNSISTLLLGDFYVPY